ITIIIVFFNYFLSIEFNCTTRNIKNILVYYYNYIIIYRITRTSYRTLDDEDFLKVHNPSPPYVVYDPYFDLKQTYVRVNGCIFTENLSKIGTLVGVSK